MKAKNRMKREEDIWQMKTFFVKEAKNAGGEERKVIFYGEGKEGK